MRGTQWEIGDCTSGAEQLQIRRQKCRKILDKMSKILKVYTCAECWWSWNVGVAGGCGHTRRPGVHGNGLSEVPEEDTPILGPTEDERCSDWSKTAAD